MAADRLKIDTDETGRDGIIPQKGRKAMETIKIRIIEGEMPEEDHTPVGVSMWYDRRLRMWTLYPVDAVGNQLRQASYAPRKDLALILKKDIEEEIASGNRDGWYY